MNFQQDFEAKRKYSRISIKKRENLVNMVIENQQTIACAARRLGLKPSTARMILNKYKKTGTYPMKNFKKPIKGAQQKIAIVKQEACDDEYVIKLEENQSGQEPMRRQVQEPTVRRQPVDQWPYYLMMMNPYQAFYFNPSLSSP